MTDNNQADYSWDETPVETKVTNLHYLTGFVPEVTFGIVAVPQLNEQTFHIDKVDQEVGMFTIRSIAPETFEERLRGQGKQGLTARDTNFVVVREDAERFLEDLQMIVKAFSEAFKRIDKTKQENSAK